MSLNEVNRQLEELLNRIKRMKKEEQLGEALSEIEDLRRIAQDPDSEIAKRNKSQDVRTYEMFTKTYKAVKMQGDALRDAGKAKTSIDDAMSIESRSMYAYKYFESQIEPKKLAVLKEFKERYSEEEVLRIKEEERDSYASKIDQNDKEINECSSFLKKVGRYDISEYEKNDRILTAINQLEKANTIINLAVTEMARLNSVVPVDTVAVNAQLEKINNALLSAKQAQSVLTEYGNLDAKDIFNPDGTVNSDNVNNISKIYKKEAEQARDNAGHQIKQNLQSFMDNAQDPLNAIRLIKKYVPGLVDIPDDFTTIDKAQTGKIVKGLTQSVRQMDLKSTQNHKYMQQIDKIEKFLTNLGKEKGLVKNESKGASDGKAKTGIKSGREYRKDKVQLDDTYTKKNFFERRKEREEYILQTMNPEAPFKKVRAWFRSFSVFSGYGYALSEAKREKEKQYVRKEKAFGEAYKYVIKNHYSPEQARIEAIKNIGPDELSGEKKAQMEER